MQPRRSKRCGCSGSLSTRLQANWAQVAIEAIAEGRHVVRAASGVTVDVFGDAAVDIESA